MACDGSCARAFEKVLRCRVPINGLKRRNHNCYFQCPLCQSQVNPKGVRGCRPRSISVRKTAGQHCNRPLPVQPQAIGTTTEPRQLVPTDFLVPLPAKGQLEEEEELATGCRAPGARRRGRTRERTRERKLFVEVGESGSWLHSGLAAAAAAFSPGPPLQRPRPASSPTRKRSVPGQPRLPPPPPAEPPPPPGDRPAPPPPPVVAPPPPELRSRSAHRAASLEKAVSFCRAGGGDSQVLVGSFERRAGERSGWMRSLRPPQIVPGVQFPKSAYLGEQTIGDHRLGDGDVLTVEAAPSTVPGDDGWVVFRIFRHTPMRGGGKGPPPPPRSSSRSSREVVGPPPRSPSRSKRPGKEKLSFPVEVAGETEASTCVPTPKTAGHADPPRPSPSGVGALTSDPVEASAATVPAEERVVLDLLQRLQRLEATRERLEAERDALRPPDGRLAQPWSAVAVSSYSGVLENGYLSLSPGAQVQVTHLETESVKEPGEQIWFYGSECESVAVEVGGQRRSGWFPAHCVRRTVMPS